MKPWRVIDCSTMSGRIDCRRGSVRVRTNSGTDELIPTADVAILLVGHGTTIGPSALHRLMQDDVTVLVCDWRGVPVGSANPWIEHGRVGARHKAQAEASLPRRKRAWAGIVQAKIRGQARVLEVAGLVNPAILLTLASRVRSGDPDNKEAQAARVYWRGLFGEDFLRLPGGTTTGVNTLLDYGYGVLRARGVRAVMSAGLSGPLGLFHRGRGNFFNLVDDLIEPFRPAIDDAVLTLAPNASLEDRLVRSHLVAASTRAFSASGLGVASELDGLAQQLGRYLEGEIERLQVPAWSGPWEVIDVDF